ncbi:methionine ABC transporter ATP-binding protein [Marinilactibacillus psychrotolerans]|uniref:Methionine ABC transporter ATP-binding protein n=1 Tax=Marinilactibacillus psychrotolerans TaxID=191770 RepID=A0A511GZU1_9LACT|nr:methionine ABC transporter ATP-binding protein [Marinilactibacillus psychrotolerans]TLQ08871.1 methionine ABC transporter ATP-binding protein [Marinilactibacillus psychrotolerans]GEL66797.1 methionine import ATP-binding protein MetN 2 [Marinilactibacillus psychrotolerans]GEQ35756.1 methionine ABC transporter ATP-binding protein [Marinilactibacillus psychrotolerans]SDC34781.1 D-methionine transport system ATP-binding protein [Marinilactibacillus psychrotolerans]
MIELKEIRKIYKTKQADVTALDDVNIAIQDGEVYGIVGYSGAGKSTLLRLLNGLEKPTSGEVSLAGKALNTLKNSTLRKERQKIGMIFQHFNLLWSRTVLENILFPLEIARVSKVKRKQRALELIRLVGLEGREHAYPSELSGGQKQRVGIARALANDPTVLLCDEATSALDPKTTEDVLELLLDINKKLNLTIVLITHEMQVIRRICDRVAVMSEGKVVEEGQVKEVFKNPKETITKQFIRQDTNIDAEDTITILHELARKYPEGKVARLVFLEDQVRSPFISRISREYDVDINIIQGSVQESQDTSLGSLYVQITGSTESIEQALQKIKAYHIEIEVIDYA